MTSEKPFFCIVLGDSDQWAIEAEWPDGSIERVLAFKARSDAVKWVITRSEAWLKETDFVRPRQKTAGP
jgi:hypothetical protein